MGILFNHVVDNPPIVIRIDSASLAAHGVQVIVCNDISIEDEIPVVAKSAVGSEENTSSIHSVNTAGSAQRVADNSVP